MKINIIYLMPVIAPAAVVVIARGSAWGCGLEFVGAIAVCTICIAAFAAFTMGLMALNESMNAHPTERFQFDLKCPWGDGK